MYCYLELSKSDKELRENPDCLGISSDTVMDLVDRRCGGLGLHKKCRCMCHRVNVYMLFHVFRDSVYFANFCEAVLENVMV